MNLEILNVYSNFRTFSTCVLVQDLLLVGKGWLSLGYLIELPRENLTLVMPVAATK